MRTCIKIILISGLISLISCGGRGSAKIDAPALRSFPMVDVPSMLQSEEEISEYAVLHFWDEFILSSEGYTCDSTYVSGVELSKIEQSFSNYIYLMERVPLNTAVKGMTRLGRLIEECETSDTASNVFETFKMLGEKYLYDPNSPMRNEDYFQPLATALSVSSHLMDVEKERFLKLSRLTSLNKAGTKAADFRFCDINGRIHTLYDIKADHTLLFFSNPGCNSCMDIINALKSMQQIDTIIREGRLAVLNIYIDEDIQEWKDYMPVYPKEWYSGFDPDFIIRNNSLYNVRAIPSLYLLDSDKKVIMKDAVPEKVIAYISRL